MILEAFSHILHTETKAGKNPQAVLSQWLTGILSKPPHDHVSQSIHTEIVLTYFNDSPCFEGRSTTGKTLLQSLYQYCDSYEHWQFTKWLHQLQASDFNYA